MTRALSLRLPQDDLDLIDRAAKLKGSSRTDFMREMSVRGAEALLLERSLVRLSPAGFKAFKATVSARAKVVPELVKLFQRRAPWER